MKDVIGFLASTVKNRFMLYIVSTPIGNLEDITLRALRILREVDFILAEDTRVTKKLLDHYEIKTPMISYFEHSSLKKVDYIVGLFEEGKNLALVTDAGTPGISDPGNKLVAEIINLGRYGLERSENGKSALNIKSQNLTVSPIPGPAAVVAALSIAGLPTDKFLFMGFIPHKKGREKFFGQVLEAEVTVVFYESCHRIIKCLSKLSELNKMRDGEEREKNLVVCREMTKKFESIYRGTVDEVLEQIKNDPIKGEYVVVAG